MSGLMITDVVIAAFTAASGVVALLTYSLKKAQSDPYLFARLHGQEDPHPGVIIENVGAGIAWDGEAIITAKNSRKTTHYAFKRLYGRSANVIDTEPGASFVQGVDKELHVRIIYAKKEHGRKAQSWEGDLRLHDTWTGRIELD